MFHVVPPSRNCEEIYKNKTHMLLGISPSNNKFSQNYIHQRVR
ncbi:MULTISPECIES: tRNA-dependent cyclodipeptide synthase [Bacillales]